MQDMIRWMCFLLALVMSCSDASARIVLPEKTLAKIRKTYDLRSDGHFQYDFVYADGSKCCESQPEKPVYFLNLLAYGPLELLYSEEINALFKNKFILKIENSTLIESGSKSFVVMTISPPSDDAGTYPRCANGAAEKRAYLLALGISRVEIVHRNFLACDTLYDQLWDGKPIGYEIYQIGAPTELLVLRRGAVIRKIEPAE